MLRTIILSFGFCLSFYFLTAQNKYELQILGTLQDGGSPHIGCTKHCCIELGELEKNRRKVCSISVKNTENNKFYVFDASPDFSDQLNMILPGAMPSGVFLSHAHIGHYTGIMYLGREAKGADNVPVYSMPRMTAFLKSNGPWSQLIDLENIRLNPIEEKQKILLEEDFWVVPFIVPHRDEYSETIGFEIHINQKVVLFIPDINKWHFWEESIAEKVKKADLAFLDATFYDQNEVQRDMKEIPHPFVVESMEIFKNLSSKDKSKVNFIHLNHTNPLLNIKSPAYTEVIKKGFKVAEIGERYKF